MKKEIDFPSGWGQDRITAFLDAARQNELATFANTPEYGRIRDIESELFLLIDNLHNAKPFHVGLFVLKAHSSLLAAIHIAMSGHVAETYPLLRASIEAALYGLFVSYDDARMETWLRRDESPAALEAVRKMFLIGQVRAELEDRDPLLGKIAKDLYDRCIALGAHPNVKMLTNIDIIEDASSVTWQLKYLHDVGEQLRLVMRTTAQTGLLVLEIACVLYPQRAAILGIPDKLVRLRKKM